MMQPPLTGFYRRAAAGKLDYEAAGDAAGLAIAPPGLAAGLASAGLAATAGLAASEAAGDEAVLPCD